MVVASVAFFVLSLVAVSFVFSSDSVVTAFFVVSVVSVSFVFAVALVAISVSVSIDSTPLYLS